jgi:hypothetical protein
LKNATVEKCYSEKCYSEKFLKDAMAIVALDP